MVYFDLISSLIVWLWHIIKITLPTNDLYTCSQSINFALENIFFHNETVGYIPMYNYYISIMNFRIIVDLVKDIKV